MAPASTASGAQLLPLGRSFGWSGAFGTHFWVDRKEDLVAIAMTQTSNQEFLRDFEDMFVQAVVGGGGAPVGTN